MAILRRIFWYLRPFKRAPRRLGYGKEVLYAGCVNLPTVK